LPLLESKKSNNMYHRIRVSGIVRHQGRILLIQQHNPRTGLRHWGLPGGGLEPTDQDLFRGAEREVFEETGLTVHAGAIRFVSEYANPHVGVMQVGIWVECHLAEDADPEAIHLGNTQHDDNIVDVCWWLPAELFPTLHEGATLSRTDFWEGLEAPVGQVTYLGKRMEYV
jgi:8-oxo-dGTP pyrophosphatase MutT (NUDIX family)